MLLIRHGTVDSQGRCYGQTDLEPSESYSDTASQITPLLPFVPQQIVTSPLNRCKLLAKSLFPDTNIEIDDRLQEVNFGHWENKHWDTVSKDKLDKWAAHPTDFCFPGGEDLTEFRARVAEVWGTLQQRSETTCIVSHAGVIRVLCSLYLKEPWQAWWNHPVPYGCVLELKNGTIGQIIKTKT